MFVRLQSTEIIMWQYQYLLINIHTTNYDNTGQQYSTQNVSNDDLASLPDFISTLF